MYDEYETYFQNMYNIFTLYIVYIQIYADDGSTKHIVTKNIPVLE